MAWESKIERRETCLVHSKGAGEADERREAASAQAAPPPGMLSAFPGVCAGKACRLQHQLNPTYSLASFLTTLVGND